MNETVKAALLANRADAKESLGYAEHGLSNLEKRVIGARTDLVERQQRLADIEAHLRDNGVDLAAVDAEAEKARPKPSALQQPLAGSYGQGLSDLGGLYGVSASNQSANLDPTAALAKALDEA